jgi:hypothetical protein
MGGFLPGGGLEGGGGGLPGIIFGVISQLFGGLQSTEDIIGAIQEAYGLAWYNTITGEQFLLDGIKSVIGVLGQVLGTIVAGLGHIITDILHGRLLKVLQDIVNLLKALGKILAPLLDWLKRLQQIQRQLQMQYLRQFIDIIQRVRKVLAIFRLLHLNFANKLDLYLAKLEGDVGAKWAKLIEHMNAIQSVLDQVIDPTLMLRPGGLLRSVGLMIGAVSAAAKGLSPSQLLCLPGPTYSAPLTQPWPVTETLLVNDMQHNTGDYAQFSDARNVALRNYAIDLGVAPLV